MDPSIPKRPTLWRSVKIGRYRSGPEYVAALGRAKRTLGERVEQWLNHPTVKYSQFEDELRLGLVSVGQAGFEKGSRYDNFYERLLSMGYEIHHGLEAAAALGVSYTDQPPGEGYRVITKPVPLPLSSSSDTYRILDVTNNGGLRIDDRDGDPERWLKPDEVFVCPITRAIS